MGQRTSPLPTSKIPAAIGDKVSRDMARTLRWEYLKRHTPCPMGENCGNLVSARDNLTELKLDTLLFHAIPTVNATHRKHRGSPSSYLCEPNQTDSASRSGPFRRMGNDSWPGVQGAARACPRPLSASGIRALEVTEGCFTSCLQASHLTKPFRRGTSDGPGLLAHGMGVT